MVLLPKAPLLPLPHIHSVPSFFIPLTFVPFELICVQIFAEPICTQELRLTTSFKPSVPDVLSPVAHKVPSFLSPILKELPPTMEVQDIPVEIITGLLIFGISPFPNAPLF